MAAAEDNRQNDRDPAASPYMIRDPEAFARNIARAIEQGGRAIAAYLKPHEEGKPADLIAEATTEVIKTLAKIGEYWTSDPARLMEAQTRLFASYFTIWQEAMARTAGSGLPFADHRPPDRSERVNPTVRETSVNPVWR